MRKERRRAPFPCPVCGADVPAKALACPECGADEDTGWGDEDAVETSETHLDDEAYEEFLDEDDAVGGGRRRGRGWVVLAVVVVTLAAYVAWAVLR